MWMAGGGVKGGQTIGTTDEIGLRAVDEPHHVWDIHASILYLLGLDHLQDHLHAQRPRRAAHGNGWKSDSEAVDVVPSGGRGHALPETAV